MSEPVTDRGRKIALWVLIIANVLFLATLVPAGIMIMFSPMAFDAGPKPSTWLFVGTLLAYPVIVLLTIIASWLSFTRRTYRLAMWLNLLPVIHLITLFVELTFFS